MKLQKFTSCFSREEFDGSFALIKGDNRVKLQKFTSCFSRVEFDGSFALIKGDNL